MDEFTTIAEQVLFESARQIPVCFEKEIDYFMTGSDNVKSENSNWIKLNIQIKKWQ